MKTQTASPSQTVEELAAPILEKIHLLTVTDNRLESECTEQTAVAKQHIEADYAKRRAEGQAEIKRLEKSLQSLLRQYQDEFLGDGKPASRECSWGVYGWRYGGDSVKIENASALELFVRKAPDANADCGTLSFKANKEGIKRRLQAGKDVPGCTLSGANRSFYELSDDIPTVANATCIDNPSKTMKATKLN